MVTTNDQGTAQVNYTVCSTPGPVKIHAQELLNGARGALTITLTQNPAWVCAASTCYWGFGWGSAQTETPFEEAQGQLWNTSPCIGDCIGGSQADLNNGVTMDAAFVAGISGQGVRNWLLGTYVAPCLQAEGCGSNSADNVSLRLHMDTIVISNAAGVLSSVSASGVMADYQAAYSRTTTELGMERQRDL